MSECITDGLLVEINQGTIRKLFSEIYIVLDVCTGIWHEIQRPDSRTYININTANVEDDEAGNFFVLPEQVADTHGTPYDFASLMHYDAFVSTVSVNFRRRYG